MKESTRHKLRAFILNAIIKGEEEFKINENIDDMKKYTQPIIKYVQEGLS